MVEWKKLGDIGKCMAGATPSTKESSYWENGTIPWMSSGEVHQGIVTHTSSCITQAGYDNASTKMLPPKTIVIALAGQGKTRGSVAITAIELCTNQSLCGVVIDDENILNQYVYYYLRTRYDDLRRISSGEGTRGGLNLKMISTYPIPIPSFEEQTRIVGILDTFTASIDNLKEQIAQRRKQYEYYRDQLLDLEGKEGVEMKYLLDVLAQPVTDGPHETPSFYEDGIPFISADAIVDNKINFSRKRGYISEEYDLLCQKKYKPQLNDIYLVKSGSTTGKVAIVKTDERFNIWSPLAAIRVNQRNHPYFVYYMLQTKKVQDQVKLKSSQGSQPNLSMRVLEKFIIPVPPLSEQQRIVSILDTFEASIQNLEAQLSQREKQYEYYRNKLLTFE